MEHLWPFLVAFGASAIVTPAAMWLARRLGAVAKPRADRWSNRPTPLLGGIALYLAFTVTVAIFGPMNQEMVGLLVAGGAIFVLGLVDDLRPLRPSVKLAGQVAAACLIVPFGIHAIFVLHPVVAIPATLLWIVAMTNAFNLLDNMDGLSAGISFISSSFTCLVALHLGDPAVAMAAATLAGATLGFLVFNFPPARVFMGDCGSLFLGFNLGSLTIMGTWHEASNLFLMLLVPLLVLAVPLFDTTLVAVMRKLSGRAISEGGRDHSSHRLVALGLSERSAVLVLYVVSAAFGGVALLGIWYDRFTIAIAISLLVVLIVFFGVFLGEVKVYGDGRATLEALRRQSPLLARVLVLKWLILEFVTDLILVSVAYLGAYVIRFEGQVPPDLLRQIHELLPIVLPIQIAALVFFGLYQEEWRYGGLRGNLKIVKAVAVGGLLSYVAVLGLTRFTFYSRGVFVISSLLLTLLLMGSRSILRLFREWFAARRQSGRRVLIVGAGDAGERVVRELRRHAGLGLTPVALLDDDPSKRGRKLHGVPVIGASSEIVHAAERSQAEEIIFAIPSAEGLARRRMLEDCARTGLPYQMALGAREIVERAGEQLLRPVRLDDLPARSRLAFDPAALREAAQGKSFLVAGISSRAALELARMASTLGAARVVVADSDVALLASSVDVLERAGAALELRIVHPHDEGSMSRLVRDVRPDVVVFGCTVRSPALGRRDLAGTLERNFTAVAIAARESTAAGVRAFLLWSSSELDGPAAAATRAGELAAAALGPARVVVIRFPSIAEDPEGALGQSLGAVRAGVTPVFLPDSPAEMVLASEIASLTLHRCAGDATSECVTVRVPPEPLGGLADLVLHRTPRAEAVSPRGGEPVLQSVALPRPGAAAVAAVEREVREALRGGRVEDALAALSRLVPDGAAGTGALVALDPVRRQSS